MGDERGNRRASRNALHRLKGFIVGASAVRRPQDQRVRRSDACGEDKASNHVSLADLSRQAQCGATHACGVEPVLALRENQAANINLPAIERVAHLHELPSNGRPAGRHNSSRYLELCGDLREWTGRRGIFFMMVLSFNLCPYCCSSCSSSSMSLSRSWNRRASAASHGPACWGCRCARRVCCAGHGACRGACRLRWHEREPSSWVAPSKSIGSSCLGLPLLKVSLLVEPVLCGNLLWIYRYRRRARTHPPGKGYPGPVCFRWFAPVDVVSLIAVIGHRLGCGWG